MRLSAKWMVLADDRILEFLQEEGPHAPSKISGDERFPWSRQHIGNRCRELARRGLLRNIGNGVYTITEDGEQYLAGELDASELDDQSSNIGS